MPLESWTFRLGQLYMAPSSRATCCPQFRMLLNHPIGYLVPSPVSSNPVTHRPLGRFCHRAPDQRAQYAIEPSSSSCSTASTGEARSWRQLQHQDRRRSVTKCSISSSSPNSAHEVAPSRLRSDRPLDNLRDCDALELGSFLAAFRQSQLAAGEGSHAWIFCMVPAHCPGAVGL